MVTDEFYGRVTDNGVTAIQTAATTRPVIRPACRWLRLSSHNTAVQRLIVIESLPADSRPSEPPQSLLPAVRAANYPTITRRKCEPKFAGFNLLLSRFSDFAIPPAELGLSRWSWSCRKGPPVGGPAPGEIAVSRGSSQGVTPPDSIAITRIDPCCRATDSPAARAFLRPRPTLPQARAASISRRRSAAATIRRA